MGEIGHFASDLQLTNRCWRCYCGNNKHIRYAIIHFLKLEKKTSGYPERWAFSLFTNILLILKTVSLSPNTHFIIIWHLHYIIHNHAATLLITNQSSPSLMIMCMHAGLASGDTGLSNSLLSRFRHFIQFLNHNEERDGYFRSLHQQPNKHYVCITLSIDLKCSCLHIYAEINCV